MPLHLTATWGLFPDMRLRYGLIALCMLLACSQTKWVEYKKSMDTPAFSKAEVVTVDALKGLDKKSVNTLDRWGGLDGVKPDETVSTNPEGFWRTGRYKGRWVMVDPDGHVAILHGINGVIQDRGKIQNTPRTNALYDKHFKDVSEWSCYARDLLVRYGFNFFSYNGYGSFDNTEEIYNLGSDAVLSEVTFLSFLHGFDRKFDRTKANVCVNLFDPDYLDYLDAKADSLTRKYRDRPHFIGYYTDNEIQFRWVHDNKPGVYLKDWLSLECGADQPRAYAYAKAYAQRFLKERFGVEPDPGNVTPEMEDAFLQDVCEYYYKTASAALRKHDPNHLVLGSRIHGMPQQLPQVVSACAKYCDVVSINFYHYWEPNDDYFIDKFKPWTAGSPKPFLISEFYTRDGTRTFDGEPYANAGEGGGWIVKGQKARGVYYQNLTRKLISYEDCVGWQWFQFTDDDYKGYGWNNKGVIAPDYEPYEDCLRLMAQLHWNIYSILDYYFK